jgi:hypothetical protein
MRSAKRKISTARSATCAERFNSAAPNVL